MRNKIFKNTIILLVMSFFQNQFIFGQQTTIVEAECGTGNNEFLCTSNGWVESFGVYTRTWNDRNVSYDDVQYKGRKANSSSSTNVNGRYILASSVFGSTFKGGKFNIDVNWIDENVGNTQGTLWFQIGAREAGCLGSTTTVCTTGAFAVNATWKADKAVAGAYKESFDNRTINPGDTIFIYLIAAGNGNYAWFDNIVFTMLESSVNNTVPVISNQSFPINENTAIGTSVGIVVASDADDDQLSYEITEGNIDDAFKIDESTGEITLVKALSFATTPSYNLTVKVTDNGTPEKSASAIITINVNETVETSLSKRTFSKSVNIFPNPAQKVLHIEAYGMDLNGAEIKILNVHGTVVRESEFMNMLSIEGLEKGMYTLMILNQGQTAAKKLMIE